MWKCGQQANTQNHSFPDHIITSDFNNTNEKSMESIYVYID